MLLACLQVPAALGAEEVPADRQVLILTRALAYDSNLKNRAGKEVTIAVLGKPGHAGSEASAAALTAAFRSLSNVKVQGLAMRTTQVRWEGTAALDSAVGAQGVDVIYVCPGFGGEVAEIIALSRRRQVLTLAASADYVDRGMALGVFPIEGRPTIVVHLAGSRAEGAAFGSDLLKLAKVIR